MDANQRKEIEERAKAARTDDDYGWLAGVDIPALLSALDAAEARAVAAESNIVGIVEYREDACMFATIGSFDPTKNRWALHWHTTLEAAEKFAESMTRHGAPALAVEIKRFFKAQGSGE